MKAKNKGFNVGNPSSGVCEQQRRRPACALAQSAQHLFYSPIGKNHIKISSEITLFQIVSLAEQAGFGMT